MTDVVLFHHAQGLTPGVTALADDLRSAGHTVHVPDTYEGRTFDDLEQGIGHAQEVGFGAVMERGVAAAQQLPAEVVYIGISLGAMPATMLAQTRPGAKGLVMLHSAIPPHEFAPEWPAGVPVQIHTSRGDEFGDAEEADGFVAAVPGTELFLYDNPNHLFVDSSLAVHDAEAAAQVRERVLAFLDRLD
jgi:dienelactone hydrolase